MDGEPKNPTSDLPERSETNTETTRETNTNLDKSNPQGVKSGGMRERLFGIFRRDTSSPGEKLREVASFSQDPQLNGDELQKGDSFDEQFQNQKTIELGEIGVNVRVVDVTPTDIKDSVPVEIAQGWLGTNDKYKDTIEGAFRHGRRVVSVEHPRTGGKVGETDVYKIEQLKADITNGVLDELGVDRVDAVAHSEGALYLIKAALDNPEKYRNLVLVSPAGLQGKDSTGAFLKRFFGMMGQNKKLMMQAARQAEDPQGDVELMGDGIAQQLPTQESLGGLQAKIATDAKKTQKDIIKNPVRFLKEAQAIAGSEIFDAVVELRKKDVRVAVVHAGGDGDPLFSMKNVGQHINERAGGRENSPFEGFYSVRGGHGDVVRNSLGVAQDNSTILEYPHVQYMDGVMSILDSMQAKREREFTRQSEESGEENADKT